MEPFLKFIPLYQERVWGGQALGEFLGRPVPAGPPVGESWEIVDRPEAQSHVAAGPWAGRTLRDVLESDAAGVMGPGWPAARRFPMLVKWLDCRERLSLQVHPPAAIAARLGGESKTENWYFACAEPGAAVLAGVRPGVSPAQFAEALHAQAVEPLMLRHAVHTGDSLLVRSGTMHAIDAGCLILEIQQNSDTTYRVSDWGRMGLDGRPRALHVRESLECLAAAPAEQPRLIPAAEADRVLADCPEFRIRRLTLAAGQTLRFGAGEQPRILSVVAGRLSAESGGAAVCGRGDNLLLCQQHSSGFAALEKSVVLITENFHQPAP